eukprot:TRINITY_DN18670_c0_g1_i1.p1 TRINITY_DN18670_c0_g1~~TRINITY_DN18670_c0_g1_i1.p1  ORF type:complete len:283 (+),score=83.98 TRINITY_DN18670_c0_g1_i1:88-936(+)
MGAGDERKRGASLDRDLAQAAKSRKVDAPAAAASAASSKNPPGWYEIPNPAFEDAMNPTFRCDSCHKERKREDYFPDQLNKMSDCPELRKDPPTIEGPWRGQLVRAHLRGFGFIACKAYGEVYVDQDGKGSDVFVLPSLVERLVGTRHIAQDLVKESETADLIPYNIRCQFTVAQQGDAKPGVKDCTRIYIYCKECIRQRQEAQQLKALRAANGGATVFEPRSTKVTNMLAKMHSSLGIPVSTTGLPLPMGPGGRQPVTSTTAALRASGKPGLSGPPPRLGW